MTVKVTVKREAKNNMTQRGKPPTGYYTATRTKRALGNITDGLLRTYVEKGLIKRLIPPGRTQGFYDQGDVLRLARSMDNFPTPGVNTLKEQFMPATEVDMPEVVQVLIDVFGGGNTVQKRTAWLKKNPETAFVVKSAQQVTGVVFILPLTRSKVEQIFADPTNASTRGISANDIESYPPNEPVCLYVASLAAKPGVNPIAKRARGLLLIRGLFAHLIDLGKRGIPVDMVVGRSDTPDGINLLKKMGFTEIEPQGDNRNFVIEVERSGIPFIMQYKQAYRDSQH